MRSSHKYSSSLHASRAGTFAKNCHRGNSVHCSDAFGGFALRRDTISDRYVVPTLRRTHDHTHAHARARTRTHSGPLRHGSKENTRGRHAAKCLEGASHEQPSKAAAAFRGTNSAAPQSRCRVRPMFAHAEWGPATASVSKLHFFRVLSLLQRRRSRDVGRGVRGAPVNEGCEKNHGC